jgi:hypothetical protein
MAGSDFLIGVADDPAYFSAVRRSASARSWAAPRARRTTEVLRTMLEHSLAVPHESPPLTVPADDARGRLLTTGERASGSHPARRCDRGLIVMDERRGPDRGGSRWSTGASVTMHQSVPPSAFARDCQQSPNAVRLAGRLPAIPKQRCTFTERLPAMSFGPLPDQY